MHTLSGVSQNKKGNAPQPSLFCLRHSGGCLLGYWTTLCMDTYISLEKYKLHFLHSVRCTEDIGIENGEAVCSDGNFYGSLCVFECEPGYSIRGTTTMTCENFGWNNPSPFCERGRLHVAAKFKKVGSVAKELGLLCCKNSCDKCLLVKKKKKKKIQKN